MTLRHLKIFVSVYQHQSITRAAEQLHLVQPSVSLAIRELETYYGIVLFDRMARRIFPTDQADRFYEYALHIVSLVEEMEQSFRNSDSVGSLRVGSSITIGNFLLPAFAAKFRETYPHVRLTAEIKNSETIVQQVLNNQVDIGIIEGNTENPNLNTEVFYHDHLSVIASPTHPLAKKKNVTLSELSSQDFLLREPGSAGREMAEALFLSQGYTIKPVWESISTQALIRGTAQNFGLSILPSLLVREELEKGTIVELSAKDFSFSRQFLLLTHKHKYLSQSAKAFLDICRNSSL